MNNCTKTTWNSSKKSFILNRTLIWSQILSVIFLWLTKKKMRITTVLTPYKLWSDQISIKSSFQGNHSKISLQPHLQGSNFSSNSKIVTKMKKKETICHQEMISGILLNQIPKSKSLDNNSNDLKMSSRPLALKILISKKPYKQKISNYMNFNQMVTVDSHLWRIKTKYLRYKRQPMKKSHSIWKKKLETLWMR